MSLGQGCPLIIDPSHARDSVWRDVLDVHVESLQSNVEVDRVVLALLVLNDQMDEQSLLCYCQRDVDHCQLTLEVAPILDQRVALSPDHSACPQLYHFDCCLSGVRLDHLCDHFVGFCLNLVETGMVLQVGLAESCCLEPMGFH